MSAKVAATEGVPAEQRVQVVNDNQMLGNNRSFRAA